MSSGAEKIVLVTGGGGGLGSAIGAEFARAGCTVVLGGRNGAALRAAVEDLGAAGGRLHPVVCDVTRLADVERARNVIESRFGAVQVLVNNAGIARASSFLEMPAELWEEVLGANLTGAYHCCRVFLPAMLAAGWGRIINIASTAAKVGFPHAAAYTASKHGLLGLTRSLALETARRGVTVNAVCPGYLDNERTRDNARRMADRTGKTEEEILDLFAATAPQHRLIEPSEVASLVRFLGDANSSGITGQAINLDGGAVMR